MINYLKEYWNFNDENKKNDLKSDLFREFYSRVKFSNKNFGRMNIKGWKSDRGKIYIRYGEPEEIKYDFNQEGEYEIWYYENREFIFINKFGIYQLYNNDTR